MDSRKTFSEGDSVSAGSTGFELIVVDLQEGHQQHKTEADHRSNKSKRQEQYFAVTEN